MLYQKEKRARRTLSVLNIMYPAFWPECRHAYNKRVSRNEKKFRMKATGRLCCSQRVRLMHNRHKRYYYNHKLENNTTEPDSCAAPRASYDAHRS